MEAVLTISLHPSLSSTSLNVSPTVLPVHSFMLSFHLFLGRHLPALRLAAPFWPVKCADRDGRTTSTSSPSHTIRYESVVRICHQFVSTHTPLFCVRCKVFSRSFYNTCSRMLGVSSLPPPSTSTPHTHKSPPVPPSTCSVYSYFGTNTDAAATPQPPQ